MPGTAESRCSMEASHPIFAVRQERAPHQTLAVAESREIFTLHSSFFN